MQPSSVSSIFTFVSYFCFSSPFIRLNVRLKSSRLRQLDVMRLPFLFTPLCSLYCCRMSTPATGHQQPVHHVARLPPSRGTDRHFFAPLFLFLLTPPV